MRLETFQPDEWSKSALFVDTLVLPVYSLKVRDKQFHFEEASAFLHVINELERRLTGRVFLLPAIPYVPERLESLKLYLQEVCQMLSESGFAHLLIVTDEDRVNMCKEVLPESAILHCLSPKDSSLEEWKEKELAIIMQELLKLWQ
jgi:hypothetical protein